MDSTEKKAISGDSDRYTERANRLPYRQMQLFPFCLPVGSYVPMLLVHLASIICPRLVEQRSSIQANGQVEKQQASSLLLSCASEPINHRPASTHSRQREDRDRIGFPRRRRNRNRSLQTSASLSPLEARVVSPGPRLTIGTYRLCTGGDPRRPRPSSRVEHR